MGAYDDLDAVLTACPSCDGLGVLLKHCARCVSGSDGDCTECEGIGGSPSLCRYCDTTGMVCAQVVISVINVDLATVASTQVVAGAHRPRRLHDGRWVIDCSAIAADLASQVSAPGLTDTATSIDEIIPLPPEYDPNLPDTDRHELEAAAIAQAAHQSRWRVRRAAPIADTDPTLLSSSMAPSVSLSCGCPTSASARPDPTHTCPHRPGARDIRNAPPITLPHPSPPAEPTGSTVETNWTLAHLTQVGFGLGLLLDITCLPGDNAAVCWSIGWSTADRTTVSPPRSAATTDFTQAVARAGAQLADVPDRLYSHGELIPVPRQAIPPVVGLWRVETALAALTGFHSGSGDSAVVCRVGVNRCSIFVTAGRHSEQLASGIDFESAITSIGL
ncbi:hypothetical protein FB566_0251 [Stackebrandtia endophytica]|uniref:Uncharacterized protein n=1 Tax=Stackebrandtia endophytica TaxID=1496996 RepID=A0A543AQC8_9ACTN|nr:hypothetical protein [Stackebrandtia endophytica]TQL74764.1 hypothetical protein FB566_0251 [Stackebrandtia endophytica]